MPRIRYDTGFPSVDAQSDFNAARRARALSRIADSLRREPDDVNHILPLEEVLAALGRKGERHEGLRTIPLSSIVGTVDRTVGFDRSFRPTSQRMRTRWERLATAMRRGEAIDPIDVFRIDDMYFVKDGHHRVSVARALRHGTIDAYVTALDTEIGGDRRLRLADLPLKGHERLFYERVPLPDDARREIQLSDAWAYGELAEAVEAWGFRRMQAERVLMSRDAVAKAWLDDEYRPVVEMLRREEMLDGQTAAEAYMRVAGARYRLLRTHEWSDDLVAKLKHSPDARA
jgi:hypothetical protein